METEMTERLAIKQKQIQAGIKAANNEGCLCEIDFKKGVMRFIHKNLQDPPLDDNDDDQPSSLAQWQGKVNGQN
jgi:hypothetical protein